jgi:hypothetical protein
LQLLREIGASTFTQHTESDETESRKDMANLRAEVEKHFDAAGIKSSDSRNRITRVFCKGLSFDQISTPEQMASLLRMLKRGPENLPPGAAGDSQSDSTAVEA